MEVGDFNLKTKNLAGAESRFREALEIRPHNPAATFKLAQTLDKLHKAQEARDTYQLYLKLQPAGPFAKDATQALQRLEKSDTSQPNPRKPH
jgi:Flp pilus assembly protein TadD